MLTRRVLVACLFMGTLLAPASAADAHHFAKRTLKKGAVGKDVRVLQDFLTRAGHRAGVDGHFGRGTWRAVRRFERANQLKVDGKATVSDQQRLQQTVTAREASTGGTELQPKQPPVEKATLAPDGLTAVAPASAPPEIKAIIEWGNKIATKPYRYGGGHARFPEDTGYDCSGSMSYALYGAKLLEDPMDSTGFMSFGKAGKGRWLTFYAHGGHSYMVVAGLRFDTSGLKQDGTRWHKSSRSSDGFTVRHLPGL